jgi:hypothetical protein
MEERKTISCLCKLRATLGRALRLCNRDAQGTEGNREKEMGHFLSSHGRWPGHEANFPVLDRILWEIGKERKKKEEKRDETGRSGCGS